MNIDAPVNIRIEFHKNGKYYFIALQEAPGGSFSASGFPQSNKSFSCSNEEMQSLVLEFESFFSGAKNYNVKLDGFPKKREFIEILKIKTNAKVIEK